MFPFMRSLSKSGVIVAVSTVVFGAAACSAPFPLVPDQTPNAISVRQALKTADYGVHLAALQDIADSNDGNRAAGTSGYEESAQYVEAVLQEAGYTPVRQPFSYQDDGEWIESFNVLADTPGSDAHTIVVGGHLDSVRKGPGINDNGSGVAAMLEVAKWLAAAGEEPVNRVRFAFWGAEEDGLEGSTHYVDQLTDAQIDETAMNLNIDIAGSPNGARFVHDGDGSTFGGRYPDGSAQIEEMFLDYFAASDLTVDATVFDGGSDYAAFKEAGIPVGGLFTGDVGIKTAQEARAYGGTAGEPHDPCYHGSCDTVDNVDADLLAEMTGALAHVTAAFASATPK